MRPQLIDGHKKRKANCIGFFRLFLHKIKEEGTLSQRKRKGRVVRLPKEAVKEKEAKKGGATRL